MLICTQARGDTSTTPDTENSQAGALAIKKADCIDFINENPTRVTCGFIELPVNHDTASVETVTLPVLIAGQTRSLSSDPSSKAILIPGGGGPGGSMGFGYQYSKGDYLRDYSELRAAGFDIVIVDQRGAGYSKPSLRCVETSNAFKQVIVKQQTFEQELKIYSNAIDTCQSRLKRDGISLHAFDTYQSAKDFLTIMELLAYSSWNTLATSYATVIAQAIEIIQPQTFDLIVLDSPVPVDYQQPYTIESSKSAIQRVLTLCKTTRRCNRKHPRIKEKFQTVLERASSEPYLVDVKVFDSNLSTPSKKTIIVSDTMLLDILINATYNNHAISYVPWVIDQLHKGRINTLQQFAEDYWHSGSDVDYADALSWTIHCKERVNLEDKYLKQNPDYANNFSTPTKLALQQERLVCKMFDVGNDNEINFNKPIATTTLILAGDLDPVISRQDINNTADDFSNATTQIIAGMGHSVWFQSKCTRKNVVRFFESPGSNEELRLKTCRDGITRFK